MKEKEIKITPEIAKQQKAIAEIVKLLNDNNLTLKVEPQVLIVPIKKK